MRSDEKYRIDLRGIRIMSSNISTAPVPVSRPANSNPASTVKRPDDYYKFGVEAWLESSKNQKTIDLSSGLPTKAADYYQALAGFVDANTLKTTNGQNDTLNKEQYGLGKNLFDLVAKQDGAPDVSRLEQMAFYAAADAIGKGGKPDSIIEQETLRKIAKAFDSEKPTDEDKTVKKQFQDAFTRAMGLLKASKVPAPAKQPETLSSVLKNGSPDASKGSPVPTRPEMTPEERKDALQKSAVNFAMGNNGWEFKHAADLTQFLQANVTNKEQFEFAQRFLSDP
ncbi:MAG: hypothetical protein VKK59_03605, partial [Vampirovibrionales bacterium]|nr:hypothetical protein [Vampirovibrionales bacterium]